MNSKFNLKKLQFMAICFIFTLSAAIFITTPAGAENDAGISGSSAEIHLHYDKSLRGKKIGFVPLALGSPLMGSWDYSMRKEAKECGMIYKVKDPNWNSQASAQAVAAFIAEGVDILVVHNMNMQLLAKLLKKAEKRGIFVFQINMVSNTKTSAFVGADWYTMGLRQAKRVIKNCGKGTGRSGKVAIMQGELTSAANIEQVEAIMSVFKKHPEIKVVSSQACNWNSNIEHDNMATILKQNPDLSATIGIWGISHLGAAQAVKEAGMTEQVFVCTSGGGSSQICDAIDSGLIDSYFNYQSLLQGHDLMTTAKFLLQSGLKPGQVKMAIYSPIIEVTKTNASYACFTYPFPKEMQDALNIDYPLLPIPGK